VRQCVDSGRDVTVYDFDGPRDADGLPIVEEVNLATLSKRLNDPTIPFGHGFIVAAMIARLDPSLFGVLCHLTNGSVCLLGSLVCCSHRGKRLLDGLLDVT